MPVRVAPPGSSAFTVTPVPARSWAQMIVSDSSAAFDGPYGEKPARCIVSRFIEILMIRPQRPRSIGRTAARAIRNGPLMLVSITERQADASASQKRVGSVMKLLLIYF